MCNVQFSLSFLTVGTQRNELSLSTDGEICPVPSGQVWKPKRHLHKNISVVSRFIGPTVLEERDSFRSVCSLEKLHFCENCKLAALLSFFQGLLASFSCPSAALYLVFFCGFFRCSRRFGVSLSDLNCFHSDCIRQEREYSPNGNYCEVFLARRKHCIKARVGICWQKSSGESRVNISNISYLNCRSERVLE